MIWGLVFAVFYALVVGYKLSKKGGKKNVSRDRDMRIYNVIGNSSIKVIRNRQQNKDDLESITGISQ